VLARHPLTNVDNDQGGASDFIKHLKPPRGASASLHFQNEKNHLPPSYLSTTCFCQIEKTAVSWCNEECRVHVAEM
jgi:hypothetical protein